MGDGERVWIVWTNRPLFDDDGKLREILCMGIDRTAQKKSEQMAAQREREQAADAATAATTAMSSLIADQSSGLSERPNSLEMELVSIRFHPKRPPEWRRAPSPACGRGLG